MKMKILSALAVGALISLGSVNGYAIQYSDFDEISATEGTLSASNPTFSSFFRISNASDAVECCFNPATEVILSATVQFTLFDLAGNSSAVNISVGGQDFATGASVPVFFSLYPTAPGALVGTALVDLNTDGTVAYSISWAGGDAFRVDSAALIAQAAPKSTAVPDGGTTIGLLGAALVALGCLRRRLS